MAEKVTVAQLDLDTTKLVENAVKTKKALEDLRVEQAKLKKGGEQSTEQFVKNEVAMKKLSTTYNEQKKVLGSLTNQNDDFIKTEEAINKATTKNITSIDQARKSNKELLALRNKLDISTDAGKDKLKDLNEKLDKNNKFIKENVSGYEEQKIGIGNYTGALDKFLPRLSATIGGLQEQKAALVASTAGTTGLTRASKLLKVALISTGIGAIVVLIGTLVAAFGRSEDRGNKLNVLIGKMSGIFKGFLKILEPLTDFILDKFIGAFDTLGKTVSFVLDKVTKGLKFLGFDGAAESIDNFTTKLAESSKQTSELADAQAKLNKQQRDSRRLQLEFQKDAEKQRQIRDDESKSIDERIAANVKLGQILQEQSKQELAIANEALRVANLRIEVDGSTTENLDARAEALTEIADIEERITGQQSEQLVNINSLRRDQAALEAEDKKRKEEQQTEAETKELERVKEFEQRKRDLLNEIALENASTEQEKAIIKAEQDLIKQEEELAALDLSEAQKSELLTLWETNTQNTIAEIKKKGREEDLKGVASFEQKKGQLKELAFNKTLGLIGEETKAGKALLLAKKIIAAKEALIGLKQLTFQKTKAVATTTTAIAEGTAQSAKIGFPQNIISLIGFASQVGGIISAIKSVGSVSAPSFADGGQIPTLRSGRINNGSNLSTPLSNGDDTLAYVRQGEVILNAEQQARAGGSAFFSRIGVPNFADGGMVGMSDVSTSTVATGSNNAQEFATIVAAEINKVKVVAIEQDITDAQITKATIIDGASI